MNERISEWIPTVRVGPVHFGDDIEVHIKNLPIKPCVDPYDDNEFYCFGFGEDQEPSYFLNEESRIENIICIRHLIYEGTDLIGLPIDRVIDVLGKTPDEFGEPFEVDDDDLQIPVEFDSLGLQLWLRDNIAVSAVVSVANEDEQE